MEPLPNTRPPCIIRSLRDLNIHAGVSQNPGYLFGDPHDKDGSILGSIMGSFCLWKLSCISSRAGLTGFAGTALKGASKRDAGGGEGPSLAIV